MLEFDLIARYFRPLAEGRPEALRLLDDAALLGGEWVITTDTIVEGVHYLGDEPPGLIAKKLLRVNLSDLAAKGARPYCYFLNLALPRDKGENWISAFAEGLREDQAAFGIFLAGGDTTNAPTHAVLSVTALGRMEGHAMLTRGGGQSGDGVFVSGTIGDAALGLHALRHGEQEKTVFSIRRYRLPEPRTALGVALRGVASACLDVSDGLVQDLGHVCAVSGYGAEIDTAKVPLSSEASAWLSEGGTLETLLTGGDDYELLFTAPPAKEKQIAALARQLELPLTKIGKLTKDKTVSFVDVRKKPLVFSRQGYQHRF